jgi:hypothetical protein
MQRRFVLIVLVAVAAMALWAGTALAQSGTKRVGVVIGLPNNARHAEVVTVPADATTFDVLQKAAIKLESANTQFGPAVCSINGTGCPADNCFCDAKRFWAYYHLGGDKWETSQEGIGNHVPADGAVEGFVWSEADANFNPLSQPPVMSFSQIQGGGFSLLWVVPALFVLAVGVYATQRRQKAAR